MKEKYNTSMPMHTHMCVWNVLLVARWTYIDAGQMNTLRGVSIDLVTIECLFLL